MKDAHVWKRILNGGLSMGQDHPRLAELVRHIVTAPIVVDSRPFEADRVAYYEDMGPLAVPFNFTWVEGPMPRVGERWGATVRVDVGKADRKPETSHEVAWQKAPGYRASVRILVVVSQPERQPFVYGQFVFGWRDDGTVIHSPEPSIYISPHIAAHGAERTEVARVIVSAVGMCCCDVFQLLACRNVALEPRDNDPKEVRRATKRHGSTPHAYRYHVLTVRPAGSKPGTRGIEIGIMPRHVCRGHFQHYGPAAEHGHPDRRDRGLLFGKHAGRFFVPPMLKGDAKNGTVEKDYAVAS